MFVGTTTVSDSSKFVSSVSNGFIPESFFITLIQMYIVLSPMASSLTAFWITLIQIHTHHLYSIFDEVVDTSPDSSPKQVLNESLDTPPEHISEQVAIS